MAGRAVAGEGAASAATLGGSTLAALELLYGIAEALLGLLKAALGIGAVVKVGRRGGRRSGHFGGGRSRRKAMD